MKSTVLIRRYTDTRYFVAPGEWTPNRDQATDFGDAVAAIRLLRSQTIPGVEVLISVEGALADFPVFGTIRPSSACS